MTALDIAWRWYGSAAIISDQQVKAVWMASGLPGFPVR